MALSILFPLFCSMACRDQRVGCRKMERKIEARPIDSSEIRIPESAFADVEDAAPLLLDHVARVGKLQRYFLAGLRLLRHYKNNRIQRRSPNLFLVQTDMLEELNRLTIIRCHRRHS